MKAKILFFGDVHFYGSKKYFIDAGDMFIEHVKSMPDNTSNNIAVFLGDLVETFVNEGIVFDQLHKLFDVMNFKKVYVLTGNHDLKKGRSGHEHVAYEFIKKYENVIVLDQPSKVDIEGYKCLALPHYNAITNLPPMYEYYSNLPTSLINDEYDFVIGHFTDSSLDVFGRTVDLSKVKTKKLILGHIHVRSNKNYIGSIFALNPLQNATDRAVWILDNGTWSESPLPNLIQFFDVTFPDALPEDAKDCKIPIYTVFNCHSESDISKIYGDIYVRQVNVKSKTLNPILQKESDFKTSAKFSKTGNYNDILSELVKTSKGTYDRGAVSILREIFLNTQVLRTRT